MREIEVIPFPFIREPMSSLSHLVGAVVFALLAIRLVRRGQGDPVRKFSLLVMSFATVQLLIFSGMYHMFWPGPWRQFMVRADVSAVFVLIAGCLTPVHTILFQGVARWAPLALAWAFAFSGIVLRMMYFDTISAVAGIALFLMFGWATSITAAILCQRYGWHFVKFAILSGLSFTVGATILAIHSPTLLTGLVGPHEIWHLSVLVGIGLYWRFVFQFASGEIPEEVNLPLPVPDTIAFEQPRPELESDEEQPSRHRRAA